MGAEGTTGEARGKRRVEDVILKEVYGRTHITGEECEEAC